jgi:hypothetical protein
MLERLSFGAAGDHLPEGGEFGIAQRFVEIEVETDPIKIQCVAQQPLCFQAGVFDPFSGKILFGPSEDF